MMRARNLIAVASIVFTSALPSLADLASKVDISASVGTGSQTAYCVIDFQTTQFAFKYNYDGVKTGWDALQALAQQASVTVNASWWNFGTDESPYLVPFITALGYGNQSAANYTGGAVKYWAYYNSKDGQNWEEATQGVSGRELGVLTDYDGNVVEGQGWDWDGWSWTPTGYPNEVAPRTPISGDFNRDGVVNDADYTVWADYYHKAPLPNYQPGKDSSGGYNDADYTNWADNFGARNTSVPEPASLTLLALSGLAVLRRRR